MAKTALATPQIEWQAVFESLGDNDDALIMAKVAHRMAMGLTPTEAAEQVGISVGVIKGWRKDHPAFERAIDLIKNNLMSFIDNRMHLRLAQADLYADWILSVNPLTLAGVSDTVRNNILKEKGLMARKMFDIAAPKASPGVTINASQAVFNLDESALRVLTERNPLVIDATPIKDVD